MDLQDINYKPKTKHVDRRMFPSGSKKISAKVAHSIQESRNK